MTFSLKPLARPLLCGAALIALATSSAQASSIAVTLDFEGATSYSSLNDFYNGGTDGAGASGSNYRMGFSGDALALSNDATTTYFSGNPSGTTVMFAPTADATLNYAAGLINSIAFYYSAAADTAGALKVYAGLDGTGALLGSVDLLSNDGACTLAAACQWTLGTLNFAGTAQSVVFASNGGQIAYDNVSVSAVPEPASLLLTATALLPLLRVGARRRTQQAA